MTFSMAAVLNMFFILAMLFTFTRQTKEVSISLFTHFFSSFQFGELFSVIIKAISFSAFVFTSHQYFHSFQASLPMPYCHSYGKFYSFFMKNIFQYPLTMHIWNT